MRDIDFGQSDFEGIKLAADWIRDLESSDSRTHKERVIEKALMAAKLGSINAQCFLFNCYLAYNPFFVYHVQQVPESQDLTDRPNPWPQFWALCENLRTRGITGHRARDAIEDVMIMFDSEEWNGLCRRVLIKDFRCGISEKTLNKVLGNTDWRIPVFSCQLAQDSDSHDSKMRGEKRLECKLDGVRVLAVVAGSGVTLYSRNGKELTNFPQVAQAISDVRRLFLSHPTSGGRFVLDGEILGKSFQALMRQAHRKHNAKTTGMVYHVFDFVPLDDFERGYWNMQQRRRTDMLDRVRASVESTTDCVRIMPGVTVDLDTAQGHDIMRRFAADAVAQGYEGIMIKDLGAPYQCKRSSHWMKWKPTITVDLAIVGFEEGTGRNAGRLGALICEGADDGRNIRVNVGSGLSDQDREQYWNDRESLLDHVVEIEADAVTQNQDGTHSLRFPRFVRFRGFDAGEKL